jgi:K+-transporting ATPase ATPase C chain
MTTLWNNFRMFLWLTLVTGVVYPLLMTGIAQLTMSKEANGDFLLSKGKVIGALMIAQKFESEQYFWPRPSAIDYNPLPSGGSNLGPTSAILKKNVEERQEKILKAHQGKKENIPSELLFASGSGLDPHISVKTANFQIDRVAKARGLDSAEGKKEIEQLIGQATTKRRFIFFGEPYVNVLLLNKLLDEHIKPEIKTKSRG